MTLMENLLNLFQVDAQVRGLRSRLDVARRYLDAQQRQLDDLATQQRELQSRQRHTQATIGNLDVETKTLDERIEKLRNELNNAVTSKQHSAFLSELNNIKAQKAQVEEKMLAEMERSEEIKGHLENLQQQVAERTKVRDIAGGELEERQAEVGQRLAELEGERSTAAAQIPANELELFDSLCAAYDGEAMAPLEEISKKHREYACAACNMNQPFENVSVLLRGTDRLVRCAACGRILYMQDAVRGSLAKK
jgi:predicted  nucleic acid-binding Zn-ribbon protein